MGANWTLGKALLVGFFLLWGCAMSAGCTELPGLPFSESFSSEKLDSVWTVDVSEGNSITVKDGVLQINASENTYAHIQCPLPADFVTVSARIKPSAPIAVTWCTSVFLVWDGGDWCQMGVTGSMGGGVFYAVETVDGVGMENRLTSCDPHKSHYVRIQLGKDCIRYFASDNGSDWKCLRTIERPDSFKGTPAYFTAGKGYGRGQAPYPNPELNNDYSDRGPKTLSEISHILIEKTTKNEVSLTPSEKQEIEEAGLDPVGKVVLQGKADPTYDQVAAFYPRMKYPREAVGVPEHPLDISVDHLGRLEVNHAEQPLIWLEAGDPALPFGDVKTEIKRRWLDGFIPVLTLATERGGVIYEQTVFGWSEGFSPDNDLYAFIRLKVKAPEGTKLPEKVWLVEGDGSKRKDWAFKKTGESEAVICLSFPFPKSEDASILTPENFDRKVSQVSKHWHKLVDEGARFDIPDKRVNEAYRAWLAYSFLDVDKVDGYCEPRDGIGFYEQIYGYSAALYCIALDYYGLHNRAERYLDTLLHFQQPDGLYSQNAGLPDHGGMLLALAEHYNYTSDKVWLKRVAPKMIAACEWIINQRKTAPKDGITRGMIKFRPYCDYFEPVYDYFGDTYCCMGLEKSAEALKAVGLNQEASRFAVEARKYRQDLLASMDAAAIRKPELTILPLEPETHRLLKDSRYTAGDYYGLVAGVVLENGFLSAESEPARWITDFMEQKRGLLAGVCQFMGGIDHAYAYGYLMTQLERDDVRKVLLGFWGTLAYGMTQDTYSAVEVTSLKTGDNYWTLPHLYSATQQLRLLRNMLIREDGSTLWIGQAVPRTWLEPGKKVAVRSAPTRFGEVSCSITSQKDGSMIVRLDPPTKQPPSEIKIRLRHPKDKSISSIKTDGADAKFKGDTITIRNAVKPVEMVVVFE